MAQDIRDLFKNEKVVHDEMPTKHEARFLEKQIRLYLKLLKNQVWAGCKLQLALLCF